MPMNGIMNLILNLLEEEFGGRSIYIIVYRCGIDIRQFLIEAPLAESDLSYLCKQMLKVVLIYELTILHSLFVYHISSYSELAYNGNTPLAELSSADRVYTVAY